MMFSTVLKNPPSLFPRNIQKLLMYLIVLKMTPRNIQKYSETSETSVENKANDDNIINDIYTAEALNEAMPDGVVEYIIEVSCYCWNTRAPGTAFFSTCERTTHSPPRIHPITLTLTKKKKTTSGGVSYAHGGKPG